MKIEEIAENLSKISEDINEEDFIYDFLLAYEQPKAAITRLKKGDYNQSKKTNEVLWKKKLYFYRANNEDLHSVIDNLTKDTVTQKQDPRFIIVTDFVLFLAVDRKTKDTLDININSLSNHTDFFLPWTGQEKSQIQNENPADIKAAERMGRLYDIIINNNSELTENQSSRHSLNIFFSRLLFCSFAEDSGIFEQNQFTKSIDSYTKKDGSDLAEYLENLFKVLNEEKRSDVPQYLNSFPYVNGGLFADEYPIPNLSQKARKMIIESGELDWTSINPDILGSMMQAVVQQTDRAEIGMHYTSVANIMKVIKPLFLDDHYEELEQAEENERKLEKLLDRIYKVKIFDPACGSGNFLVISYKELCRLEIEIFKKLQDLNPDKWGFATSGIRLNQFYGIEIDDFAHETTKVSLWLAQHQMNLLFNEVFGEMKPSLPLMQSGNIFCENSLRINWKEICPNNTQSEVYLIGNPPYAGSRKQKKNQKDDMDFVFDGLANYKLLDYVTAFIYKGSEYIEKSNSKICFVTTNSCNQGEQVGILWPKVFSLGIEIEFAYSAFKWTNNAKGKAGVSVNILCLSAKKVRKKYIFRGNIRHLVNNISPYVTEGSNVIVKKRKTPISLLPKMFFGNMPRDDGNLILSLEEMNKIVSDNEMSEKFIKKYIGAKDFINGSNRWCLWINDDDYNEAKQIKVIERRLDRVREFRRNSDAESTQKYADRAYKFVQITHEPDQALLIPRVSSERREYLPIGFINNNDTVIADSAQAIYKPPVYLFALLSSKMHLSWVKLVSGRLESRFRYSSTISYNTFFSPRIEQIEEKALEDKTFDVLSEREKYSELTIAQLYDPQEKE